MSLDRVRPRDRARLASVSPSKAGPVKIWILSADNPDAIRGYGFDGLVIDEAASISQDVWHYVLRPTISQTLGWAVFVSTPKGWNWFYDLFTRGMDPNETDVTGKDEVNPLLAALNAPACYGAYKWWHLARGNVAAAARRAMGRKTEDRCRMSVRR